MAKIIGLYHKFKVVWILTVTFVQNKRMIQRISSLVKGDTVLIITPAKSIEAKYIKLAIQLFESWGLQVEVGAHALGQHHYFSGTDSERIADLQWAVNHPTAKAIICARGGYGTIRIVDEVDYSNFLNNPKWMVGFSDVTVLHNKLHADLNLPTIHGLAPLYLDQLETDSETLLTLKKALFGDSLEIDFTPSTLNKKGIVTGTLVGGNLAILESLIGTSLDIDTEGKILFLEDVSEYAYKIDRMFWSLKKSGKLKGLRGLVIGGLTDIKQSEAVFGCAIEIVIQELVSEYDFPVAFNFPAGHQLDNRAIILGYTYQLSVTNQSCTLKLIQNG